MFNLIQEYRVKVLEHYIVDYCDTSPRKHKHQCFTYLKKFPGGNTGHDILLSYYLLLSRILREEFHIYVVVM